MPFFLFSHFKCEKKIFFCIVKGYKSKFSNWTISEEGLLNLKTEKLQDANQDQTEWAFKPTSHQMQDGFKDVFRAQATRLLLKGRLMFTL